MLPILIIDSKFEGKDAKEKIGKKVIKFMRYIF